MTQDVVRIVHMRPGNVCGLNFLCHRVVTYLYTAGKVVAHAFFPDDVHGGNVHFDADETWTVTASEGHLSSV